MATVDDLTKRQALNAKANAAGICDIKIQVPSNNMAWNVSQVTINCAAAPFGATANMFLNDDLVTPMVPTGDAAGGDPSIGLLPGDTLLIRWTGLVVNTQGKALVFYTEAGYAQ